MKLGWRVEKSWTYNLHHDRFVLGENLNSKNFLLYLLVTECHTIPCQRHKASWKSHLKNVQKVIIGPVEYHNVILKEQQKLMISGKRMPHNQKHFNKQAMHT